MFMPVLSGIIVSVDAFFIGISLGLQKKCKFLYLFIINLILISLCIVGFLIAERIYEYIFIDTDLVVGLAFISLGSWYILSYLISKYIKRHSEETKDAKVSSKTIIITGFVMSLEAMLITIGITFVFLPHSTFLIPIVVGLAHFGYSALSFFLVRTKHMRKMPIGIAHVVSGLALITYGLMAVFIEFGI
ncbi:MAG: manganese efflux pump [Oscillospiraceae bacterium]|nr:manganese efflux pump [Oscillospiraceae bacterium]